MAYADMSAKERARDHVVWGFVATIILTTILRLAQAVGFTRMDLPLMLGTLVTPDRDRAKVWGFLLHMTNGLAFGGVYRVIFQSMRRSGLALGALIGLAHGIFVLVSVLPLLPGIHPRMASDFTGPQPTTRLEPPGFLATNYGTRTPIVTVAAHVLYGAILGYFYRVGDET